VGGGGRPVSSQESNVTRPFEGGALAGPAARPRRLVLVTLWLMALLLGNELFTAASGLAEKFAGAKVMISLTDEMSAVGLMLVGEALRMLALAVALAALPCMAWAAFTLQARTALARPLAVARWRRWVFWSVSFLCFFNLWYGLHSFFLPGSTLVSSWLASAVGAARFPTGGSLWQAERLGVLAMTLPVGFGFVVLGLARSRTLRRTLLGGVALTLASVGLSAVSADPGAPEPFTAEGSVVLLGLDSFQSNRLAHGGGDPDLAPHIDGFLEQSRRFDNAWTPFARTYPSWVSILSGRFPARHGVRFNLTPDQLVAPDNDWLPARLAEQGFTTFHATDECRFSLIREEHGFDHMLHPPMGTVDFMLGSMFDFSVTNLARLTRLGHDLFPAVAHNRASRSYSGDLFAEDVIAALDELPRDEPVFAVVHLCGNHYPFTTHWPYARQGRDAVEASIAMVDAQVGTILDWMEAAGLSQRATTVMLSDHGDGWSGDHEDETNEHGDDLDEAVANKVLLAVKGPGVKPGRSHDLVRTLDLYPTVMEWAGLGWDSRRVDGQPLQPWLTGGAVDEPARTLFAESGIGRKVFGMKRLVQEHIDWYAMDPSSGLVFLRPEGVDEFMPHKSYMLMEQGVRLVVTPSLGRFRLAAVDPATGLDLEQAPELPSDRRREMLGRLLAHNGLQDQGLWERAEERGFLD
jgi:arylsulfatase A-like enzyme